MAEMIEIHVVNFELDQHVGMSDGYMTGLCILGRSPGFKADVNWAKGGGSAQGSSSINLVDWQARVLRLQESNRRIRKGDVCKRECM